MSNRTVLHRRALAAAIALSSCLGGGVRAQPLVPDGFAIEAVALVPSGALPTGFARLPDGRTLVIEKNTAQVRLAVPGSTATTVIATLPGVTTTAERGLLGIAVDPGWPARPFVYLHSTRIDATIKITMHTATGDLTDPASTNLALGATYVLLDDIPDIRTTHNGGTLRFGPEGLLYVSLGDDVQACEAQLLASPRGKILRLDVAAMPGPGTGPPPKVDLVPAIHPFTGPGWEPLVYAYGLRNPFRFTIDAATGNLYIGDVGLETWEEVDELVQVGYAGDNYGWPEFEGPLQDPDPIFADCSTPPFVAPVHVYPNPPATVATVVCGPVYRTDPTDPYAFPRSYDGSLFLADFYGGWIRRLERDGGAWGLADSVPGQPSATHWATNLTQTSDLQLGSDGALYFQSFIQGSLPAGVHRIVSTMPSDVAPATSSPGARVWPNPATRAAGVALELRFASPGALRIAIYDPAGRLVRVLREPGAPSIVRWDGRRDDGRTVSPGLYPFLVHDAAGRVVSGKILLAR